MTGVTSKAVQKIEFSFPIAVGKDTAAARRGRCPHRPLLALQINSENEI